MDIFLNLVLILYIEKRSFYRYLYIHKYVYFSYSFKKNLANVLIFVP